MVISMNSKAAMQLSSSLIYLINNGKYSVKFLLAAYWSFLMAEVYRVFIKYPDLRELSLLEYPLVRSVIAKSLSASMAGPKVSFKPLQDSSDHQVLIR